MTTLLESQDPNCQEPYYDENEYEAGDQAYILRLKVLLFEQVLVIPLDHGHKLIRCSNPRDP